MWFDQRPALRSVTSMLVVIVPEGSSDALAGIDTLALVNQLRTSVELELRRDRIRVLTSPACPNLRCPRGVAVLMVNLLFLGPVDGRYFFSHELLLKQQATLVSDGGRGFFTTWNIGGIVACPVGESIPDAVSNAIKPAIERLANDYLTAHQQPVRSDSNR